MKFVDEDTRDRLAKSSTVLQCILSILDYECHIYHSQPEVVSVFSNIATIDLDPMRESDIMEACMKVNKQFKRKDGNFTCQPIENGKTFVRCEALPVSDYIQLT